MKDILTGLYPPSGRVCMFVRMYECMCTCTQLPHTWCKLDGELDSPFLCH